jgi:hypothetical protein
VRKPEDMAGLKIRVPESPVWVEMVRGFGASPTPIPFGEVYTALQQKTVDGQENPIPTIYSRKFYEVQGYLTMSRHMLQNNTIIMNKNSLAKLSPEQKILLRKRRRFRPRTPTCSRGARRHARTSGIGQDQGDRRPDRAAFQARSARSLRRQRRRHLKRLKAEIARVRAGEAAHGHRLATASMTPPRGPERILWLSHGVIAALVVAAVIFRYFLGDPLI